jgi:hypothetical protein
MLEAKAFKRLDDTGFTLAELSALYFSRTLVEVLAATPFQQDVASAFDKLAAALTPACAVPRSAAAGDPGQGRASRRPASAKTEREHIARLLDAHAQPPPRDDEVLLDVERREKEYVIEPYRWSTRRGMYLRPSCRSTRVPHVLGGSHPQLSLHEERFTPAESGGRFAHSLGVNEGRPSTSRSPSSRASRPTSASGSGTVAEARRSQGRRRRHLARRLQRLGAASWILSFGPLARVLSRRRLKSQIKDEIDRAAAATR